jgi:hypothetical protein
MPKTVYGICIYVPNFAEEGWLEQGSNPEIRGGSRPNDRVYHVHVVGIQQFRYTFPVSPTTNYCANALDVCAIPAIISTLARTNPHTTQMPNLHQHAIMPSRFIRCDIIIRSVFIYFALTI